MLRPPKWLAIRSMPNPYHDKIGRFTTKSGDADGVAAGSKEKAAAALRQYRAQGKTSTSGSSSLNVTDSAPPKGKPVILVYGGAFNPPHEGHANGALKAAHDALASGGYTVAGSIVAPTADKLLADKLGPADRLSLDARARLSRIAFPDKINGAPVRVETGPSEEVERSTGKPRRTDLARWAQRKYPNHTIVNVTGEDAVVPGSPQQHPSIYSGEAGSNHEGYYYITLPRDMGEGGISSSKIRAAEAAGTKIPGMSAESERAYRTELAKHRSTMRKQR